MFLDAIVFSETIALGMTGGPRFSTTIAPSPSGDEALMAHWTRELGAWDLAQRHRTDAETITLLMLFRLACGRAHGFRLHDPSDDTTGVELIGTGDATTTVFQLLKTYDDGAYTYTRRITKPIAGTTQVWLNGVAATGYVVSSATGLVTFTAPPGLGVLVTAWCQFHVPVRFDIDACDLQMVEPGITTWGQIRLVELPDVGLSRADDGEAVADSTALIIALGVAAAGAAGPGYLPTHFVNITPQWTLPQWAGGEATASVEVWRSFWPTLPTDPAHYVLGPFTPPTVEYAETNIYGDYQGGAGGVVLVPVGTIALDANIYEEALRKVGIPGHYNYQAFFTSVSGKRDASKVVEVQHVTYPPSEPVGVFATFVDGGEFFSYVTFGWSRPTSLYGILVYFYFCEININGGGWTPFGTGTTGEILGTTGDSGATYTANSGFANRTTAGTFAVRLKAQNDWGTSGWSNEASCVIPAYP